MILPERLNELNKISYINISPYACIFSYYIYNIYINIYIYIIFFEILFPFDKWNICSPSANAWEREFSPSREISCTRLSSRDISYIAIREGAKNLLRKWVLDQAEACYRNRVERCFSPNDSGLIKSCLILINLPTLDAEQFRQCRRLQK